jgi:Domain of unknown function (DUF4304)
MNKRRRAIDSLLRHTCVPLLRERGFRGAHPHFRRLHGEHVDLLMFQFRRDGTSFVVEISYADPERNNVGFRPEAPAVALEVPATRERYRLGAKGRTEVDGEWLGLAHGILVSDDRHFRRLTEGKRHAAE